MYNLKRGDNQTEALNFIKDNAVFFAARWGLDAQYQKSGHDLLLFLEGSRALTEYRRTLASICDVI